MSAREYLKWDNARTGKVLDGIDGVADAALDVAHRARQAGYGLETPTKAFVLLL